MREVARTLRELGVPDRMASATADWQASIGALGLVLDAEAPVSSAADTVLTGLSRDL
jgi:hypothetical protein